MRLLIVADTHVPRRARDLPTVVWRELDRADVVVHAGDWTDLALLDAMTERLATRAARLVAVHGNNDDCAVRARLPEVATVDLDGVHLVVVHETGPAAGRDARCAARFPGADVVVFGHSHIPWDSAVPGGPRLLNPGSPTDRRRQPACTYLTARATRGQLSQVRLHPIKPDMISQSTRPRSARA